MPADRARRSLRGQLRGGKSEHASLPQGRKIGSGELPPSARIEVTTETPTPKGRGFPRGIGPSQDGNATTKSLPACKAVPLTGSAARAVQRWPAQINDRPRQNSAYRPGLQTCENPRSCVGFRLGELSVPYTISHVPPAHANSLFISLSSCRSYAMSWE